MGPVVIRFQFGSYSNRFGPVRFGSIRFGSILQAQKNNDLRFELLVRALLMSREPRELPQAVGVAVFLNAVLASAFEFDERVLLRGEMIKAGVMQAIRTVRARFGLMTVISTSVLFPVCVCERQIVVFCLFLVHDTNCLLRGN